MTYYSVILFAIALILDLFARATNSEEAKQYFYNSSISCCVFFIISVIINEFY